MLLFFFVVVVLIFCFFLLFPWSRHFFLLHLHFVFQPSKNDGKVDWIGLLLTAGEGLDHFCGVMPLYGKDQGIYWWWFVGLCGWNMQNATLVAYKMPRILDTSWPIRMLHKLSWTNYFYLGERIHQSIIKADTFIPCGIFFKNGGLWWKRAFARCVSVMKRVTVCLIEVNKQTHHSIGRPTFDYLQETPEMP